MGWAVFPPCYMTWSQTMVEVMKIMVTSFKRSSCAHTITLSAPDLAAGHHWPTPLPETPVHSWERLGQSVLGSLLLSPGSWCTQGFVCAFQESVSPVLWKFWWLSGGVNGDLLQEGLCRTQVCCTQSLCPCSSPLLTCTSIGDTQKLKGRSGSVSVGCPGAHKLNKSFKKSSLWQPHLKSSHGHLKLVFTTEEKSLC